ncbi:Clan CA, family C19, ubiquitin hydrolase-like cysteine peptidase [Trichomonas vaginalis G3]|uniref:ubiquitinyl hydrolase 1 n=1 Tax=Trichomonas vaginalis (strain ATCC PRA-98 / G3) TaxID=412133 RepID=A2E8S7_TRIV3|nr:Clan CA, family C19, ubiquitin hydrolase-like cysteine peptidase family [Trichomonas vaginalis G3]EAY10909.1 Clan CA, family C19, ubiquitin hydrolase-like cysteine peptidase [Trichomonas vaginalis G3]KAI5485553.1 Clan CA, family C19, ubiquitin hydrolase-like cysteine peptidase family [Trichomonas vaginalis G3]|eukprot:XP_001323132.1 Clan CA, family C19, ubiquitin hydrolase-like cysteine peptidase [Trichomonas vaginalis G3]
MKHLGTNPKWIEISGNVEFPEEIASAYKTILQDGKDSIEKDFATNLQTGKYFVTPMVVQPRGLMNRGLMCFANASIQLLFASPPFVSFANFMKTYYPLFSDKQREVIPSWTALYKFLNNFKFSDSASSDGVYTSLKSLDLIDKASATNTDILNEVFGPFNAKRKPKTQEDASEFLSYFLNKLHDELCSLIELYPVPESSDPNNRRTVIGGKIQQIVDTQGKLSPLSKIFATFVRSETLDHHKVRSVNAEVTLVLQLPIYEIKSLGQAIRRYLEVEQITDTISKRNHLTALPMSLIIGFTRFGFNDYGPMKLTGIVEYPEILRLEADDEKFSYQLSAVVEHIGTRPDAGHYVCYARRFDGQWLKFDDDKVSELGDEGHLGLQAYMLLYNRITSE